MLLTTETLVVEKPEEEEAPAANAAASTATRTKASPPTRADPRRGDASRGPARWPPAAILRRLGALRGGAAPGAHRMECIPAATPGESAHD